MFADLAQPFHCKWQKLLITKSV